MINGKAIELLNYRINQEEYSSRLYEYLSICLDDLGYEVSPKLWKKYSQEELEHAQWAKDYLLSFGIIPELREIPSPYCDCTNLAHCIEESYKHEKTISEQCNQMAIDALKMQDHMLYTLAIRYCKEQVEEMQKVQTLVDKLETYGRDKVGLIMLDNSLKEYL
jgi:ferritin